MPIGDGVKGARIDRYCHNLTLPLVNGNKGIAVVALLN